MEPTIYKPSIYKGAGIYNTGANGGGGGGDNYKKMWYVGGTYWRFDKDCVLVATDDGGRVEMCGINNTISVSGAKNIYIIVYLYLRGF